MVKRRGERAEKVLVRGNYLKTVPKMAHMSQKWLDVLIPFFNSYTLKLTSKEITKRTGIPKRTVLRILNALVKRSIVRYNIEGKNKRYYLDLKDHRTKLLARMIESYKALKFSQNERKVYIMIEEIIESRGVILFGSYAKGHSTKDSDIDILIIGSENEKVREIARKQVKEINLHFSTLKNLSKLVKKKNVLAMEIMKNHIAFDGGEFVELCWRFYRNEL